MTDDPDRGAVDTDSGTVLVHVTGRDRPGLTARLLGVLAAGGAEVHDVEQIVVRERLTLDLLIDVRGARGVLKDLLFLGWEQGVDVDFEVVEDDSTRASKPRSTVTAIGSGLGPAALGAVARAVADAGGNIDRIVRLSRYPVISYELEVVDGDLDELRSALLDATREHAVDVAVQPERLSARAKRLVVLDVDSTLIQDEVIELLAEERGCLDEVEHITRRAMEGELDFEGSLRERVALLEGLDTDALVRVRDRIRLTPGARTFVRTLKRMGMQVAIVSGGFSLFTDHLVEQLDLDAAEANELEVVDGRVTGAVVGTVVDRARKAAFLRETCEQAGIPTDAAVAIGDGANDLDMLNAAGLGIAFNAKPVVREAADTTVSVPFLDAVLFLLGVRREEVERADAKDAEAAASHPSAAG